MQYDVLKHLLIAATMHYENARFCLKVTVERIMINLNQPSEKFNVDD